jgi:hypothetical protein
MQRLSETVVAGEVRTTVCDGVLIGRCMSRTGVEGLVVGSYVRACVRGAATCCSLIQLRGVSSITLYVYNIPYYVHERIEYSNFLRCFLQSHTFSCVL